MHDPYHPAGRPRADERPAARRATPVRIRHMLLHFGAIGRGPGDARRCPRGAARGRAPMNRTASDSADCPAPFQPTPDAAMHAGSPAVHRSAARRGAARKRRNARGRSIHRIGEIPPIDASGTGSGRTACRAPALQCAGAQLAGTLRRVVTRRAAAPACPRISAIDPAPPPQAVPFHRRAALRQAGTSRPPFRSFQEMHRSKLPAQSFPFVHRRPFPL